MPIQIIDNFDLNSAKPIDNRFVVGPDSFYLNKEDIPWKYPGMRIWDLNVGLPFVWTGTTYSSENLVNINGSGTINYLPKFLSSTTNLGNSVIYDDGVNIGIGNTSPTSKLDVTGTIKSTYFTGDGSNITSINASNVTQGVLGLNRLQNSVNPNWIMTSGVGGIGQVSWVNSSSISVGSANQLSTTRTLWGQNFNGTQNVTGNISVNGSVTNITGSVQFKNVNNGILSFYWTGTTNINQNLKIPSYVNITSVPRTLALLEQSQIFTGVNTFTDFQNFEDNIQVGGTSSFNDEISVYVTKNLGGFLGNVTQNPLNVQWTGICIGSTSSKSSPYITVSGEYTWYGDDTSMYRITTHSGVTYSGIAFKTDGYTQMVLNNLTGTYSTGAEHYSTPGIAMMSVLDVWYVDNFNLASVGTSWWLNTASNVSVTTLPTTSTTYNASVVYDRMVAVSTGGMATASVYLETDYLSGSYWNIGNLWKDSNYTFIIPAGRRWKLSMNKVGQSTVTDSGLSSSPASVGNAQSNNSQIKLISYKWGMN